MNIYARTRFTWSLEFARIRGGSVVVHACNRRGSSLSLLLSRSCTPLFERRGESSVLGILSSCSVSSPRKAEPTGRKFRIAFPEWPRIRPYPWQEMNAKALKEEGWGARVTKKERMKREREIGRFAIISGKFAPSPAQTVPVGCSAFVWTLVET